MDYPMTVFVVKLLLFIAAAFFVGFLVGMFFGSPEFGVGIFLLLSVSFKREVFTPSDL
jgi:hypothetical protein